MNEELSLKISQQYKDILLNENYEEVKEILTTIIKDGTNGTNGINNRPNSIQLMYLLRSQSKYSLNVDNSKIVADIIKKYNGNNIFFISTNYF